MKAIATLSFLSLLLFTTTALPGGKLAFVPAPGNKVRAGAASVRMNDIMLRDDSMNIAQELQHLAAEIRKYILHKQPPAANAAAATDSSVNSSVVDEGDTSSAESHSHLTIQELRDEMLERDAQYRTMLLGFQNVVAKLAMIVKTESSTLQAENKDMKRSIQMYEQEYESVLNLLARAANLMMRRITTPIREVPFFIRYQKERILASLAASRSKEGESSGSELLTIYCIKQYYHENKVVW
jgi:hypothetical protein